MIYYVGAWVALMVFVVVWYFIRRKRINAAIKRIDDLNAESERLKSEVETLNSELFYINQKRQQFLLDYKTLEAKVEYEQKRAKDAKDSTDRLLATELERAKTSLKGVRELEEQRMQHEFQERERALEQQFKFKKQQFADDFLCLQAYYQDELGALKGELDEYAAKRAAVNEAILRERELEEKEDFYRIIIRDMDARDIDTLRSIESHLCNKEVLNRLIYEVFIKRPLMEMEKRVLNGRKVGGIYKITYIKTGESYIGRSVDIGNRWKEHCLSSLNIGTIAHSTFHNVLADKGIQNFTWEVLEEVDKDKQSSREKYWIDFYQTDKQFNQKAGG